MFEITFRFENSEDTVVIAASPEETILALCLEYFNDANPCHIHRSAVCLRAVAELEQACPRGETVRVDALPAQLRRFFAPGAETVRIEEEAL